MRVLLATDGSTPAGMGVDLVGSVDWPEGTAIRVLQAIDPSLPPDLLVVGVEALEADLRAAARSNVEATAARLEAPGRNVTTAVVLGRAASAIVDSAEALGADLVVLGSRGHGPIETMLLGSVSAEVADHAAAPVLVARRPSIRRAVLAWDGSDCARLAADMVRTSALFRGAAVRVVSVADVGTPWWAGMPASAAPRLMPVYVEAREASRQSHARFAEEMAAELRATGIDAVAEPREGDAAAGILAAAAEWDADIIVVGTHGRTGLARLLLGSVARNVLTHATSSVLIARGPQPGG